MKNLFVLLGLVLAASFSFGDVRAEDFAKASGSVFVDYVIAFVVFAAIAWVVSQFRKKGSK